MNIRFNILATLAYYDVLDMPLTVEDIRARLINFKHLDQHKDIAWPYVDEVKKELDQMVLDQIVNRTGNYYFLLDREHLVSLRVKRERIAKLKWQKARRAIRWLRFLPYVRAIFASGSLAINNTDELSDLDVLIVLKSGRIWLGRLFIVFLLSFLGMRRKGSQILAPDKICLNHYITSSSLSIAFRSLYNAQTYSNLVPVYVNDPELVQQFKKANAWVLDYLFNWNVEDGGMFKNGQTRSCKVSEFFLGNKLGDRLENLARKYQTKRIASNPIVNQPGGRVVFNDYNLEFHPKSIEGQILKAYNSRLVGLGLAEFAIERDSGLGL